MKIAAQRKLELDFAQINARIDSITNRILVGILDTCHHIAEIANILLLWILGKMDGMAIRILSDVRNNLD